MRTMPGFRSIVAAGVLIGAAACGGGTAEQGAQAAAAPASSAPAPASKQAESSCKLTVEQVTAVAGVPMTLTGGCTFFPAKGGDIPHVFYIQQVPMLCNSISPKELGFTEPIPGLPAREAYVKDALDGSHVLVCPNGNARAFDIVVEIKNNKAQNREIAVALAKQVLAGG